MCMAVDMTLSYQSITQCTNCVDRDGVACPCMASEGFDICCSAGSLAHASLRLTVQMSAHRALITNDSTVISTALLLQSNLRHTHYDHSLRMVRPYPMILPISP